MNHNHPLQIPKYIFFGGTTALLGPRPPHCRGFSITYSQTQHTLQDFPARRIGPMQRPVSDKHKTFPRDRHACTRRESNPQSQPVIGRRPTPQTGAATGIGQISTCLLFTILFHTHSTSYDVIRHQHQLRGRVHIERLASIELIDKCTDNYGTVKLSTDGCHWFLSRIRGINSTL